MTILTTLFSSLSNYTLPESPSSSSPWPNQQSTSPTSHPSTTSYSLPPPNPLLANPSQTKSLKALLTTFHLLYPNEFLPALDLIDRGLITKLVLLDLDHGASRFQGVYIVRSAASARSGAGSGSGSGSEGRERWDGGSSSSGTGRKASYEVRIKAWNCSCPAFGFEVVGSLAGSTASWEDDGGDGGGGGERTQRGEGYEEEKEWSMEWRYGGLRMRSGDGVPKQNTPICKHLLACLLVERCPLFRDCIEIKKVSSEEIAAWAAGWGD